MSPDAHHLRVVLPDSSDVAQSGAAVELNLWVRGLQQENQNRDDTHVTQDPPGPVWGEKKQDKPYSLNPTSWILNPKPYTLNSKLYTLNPKLYTLNPKHYTLNSMP